MHLLDVLHLGDTIYDWSTIMRTRSTPVLRARLYDASVVGGLSTSRNIRLLASVFLDLCARFSESLPVHANSLVSTRALRITTARGQDLGMVAVACVGVNLFNECTLL